MPCFHFVIIFSFWPLNFNLHFPLPFSLKPWLAFKSQIWPYSLTFCYRISLNLLCRKCFHSYCTSYYGCKQWSHTTNNISDFCTSWCCALRAIGTNCTDTAAYTTHCYLLLLICHCLPVFDELCRRSIKFARSCVLHESQFISQIASYCIHFARCESPMGLFCAERFQTNIDRILNGSSITLFIRITVVT